MTDNRECIYSDLMKKMEYVGFVFEKEQQPHLQKVREKELKFIHPELHYKFESNNLFSRATKYYIKQLSDEKNGEIGLTTGKTSHLYNHKLFPMPNSFDTYKNPNNELNAWVNIKNEDKLDELLRAVRSYLLT